MLFILVTTVLQHYYLLITGLDIEKVHLQNKSCTSVLQQSPFPVCVTLFTVCRRVCHFYSNYVQHVRNQKWEYRFSLATSGCQGVTD